MPSYLKAFFVVDSHVGTEKELTTYSLILKDQFNEIQTQDIHYVTGINILFSTENKSTYYF